MRDLKEITAEELMLRYQTHSPDEAYAAFNELYSRYSQRVFNFLNKKVKNSVDGEDLLQKVFIKIHESKHLYSAKYKFEQWLFVIARTQALDYFRANKRYQDRMANYEPEVLESSEVDMSLLKNLDSDQQELLEMKFIDELSYQEIAKIVNKSEVSLRKTLSRMVGRLKKGEAL
ncbi:sigma-70 family RNA polymerase sigma factor [Bacteriovorax sp. PP10]|uniref:Sigma-70 family RNA polymerase sigma factor n=1 Tax=Bacteriovorax antarcticus TaxID=3088717 RepID=A0ABU5VVR6_9BACT|nr:sigma-70 family RNA polymerase sigma factor [Bacteriovorax sp. PP10]MEA9357153.1 sigma-70 family RNA polymerase sigma factor [Bacteriovorax sp. PP10]